MTKKEEHVKFRGFTLIELLLVIAIMGLMGTAAVGSYRAMQRGMEERGAMQTVNQFIRSAYQRAQIDRAPVIVYFWNETLREESDTDSILVVGKAVAVRRAGRITAKNGDNELFDEFGDLRAFRLVFDEDDDSNYEKNDVDTSSDAQNGIRLFNMKPSGDSVRMNCSIIAPNTLRREANITLPSLWAADKKGATVERFMFSVKESNGVTWRVGDEYGFEFAEIQLPENYIFERNFSRSLSSPLTEVKNLRFKPGQNSGNGSSDGTSGAATVLVSSLRPSDSGTLEASRVAQSENPTKDLK